VDRGELVVDPSVEAVGERRAEPGHGRGVIDRPRRLGRCGFTRLGQHLGASSGADLGPGVDVVPLPVAVGNDGWAMTYDGEDNGCFPMRDDVLTRCSTGWRRAGHSTPHAAPVR
jgi:hypothetical protein